MKVKFSRRTFLQAGALVVGYGILPTLPTIALADSETDTLGTKILAPNLPGSLKSNPYLDAWISISPANHIVIFSGKVELGTGIRTALLQIAAERLCVEPNLIEFITADTGRSPNEGYTAGSHTVFDSGTALMHSAAQVREMLVESASKTWGVEPEDLRTEHARIHCRDGRSMSYGEAVAGADLHRYADAISPTLDPKDFRLIGHSLQRVDIPAKVTGGAAYVQDMRLPRMLHARVVRPPRRGAQLLYIDGDYIEALPGVVKMVRNGSFLAVVAIDEWQAIQAMRQAYANAQWGEGDVIPDSGTIHNLLQKLPGKYYKLVDKGDVGSFSSASLKQTQRKQYLMHASIGPSCSVAEYKDGVLTVWTHTQGVFPLRGGLCELVKLPPEKVRCIHMEGSGCYGHNGADDVAADAALVAMALSGNPVRVQWMREQENLWEPYSSAMLTDLQAELGSDQRIGQWKYALWSNPHNERIANAGRLLAARLIEKPIASAPSVPVAQPEGDGDRNSIPAYDIPNLSVEFNFVTAMPIRTSAMRSLGGHLNVFSIESAIDDLARAAGKDPVDFRLAHLSDPRAVDVVQRTARQFGWPKRSAEPSTGVGFAYARYKNQMGYCAVAVELHVNRQTGEVIIERVVTAVDVGQVVNPDGLINQTEGGVLQSASWTLFEEVVYGHAGIASFDWSGYPIMRFKQTPKKVDVVVIDRPGLPFLGAAEIVQGPMAGALGNAMRDALGVRLHDLPLARRGWHLELMKTVPQA